MPSALDYIFGVARNHNLHIVTATSNDGILFFRVFKQFTKDYNHPGRIGTFRGCDEVMAFLDGYCKAELVLA